MDDKKKQILLIVGLIAGVVIIAFALYYFFFRTETVPQFIAPGGQTSLPDENGFDFGTHPQPGGVDVTPGTPQPETPPEVGQTEEPVVLPEVPVIDNTADGGQVVIQPVLPTQILSPVILPSSEKIVYYKKDTGRFYKLQDTKTVDLLSDKVFPEANKILWSPVGTKAVIEFPDESKVIYNFDTGKQITLAKEMKEFSFSKNGDTLAFKWQTENPNENFVGIADGNGQNIRFVEFIGKNADNVQVAVSPNNKVVATYREPADARQSKIFFIGKNDENFKLAAVDGFGVEAHWGNTGKFLALNSFVSSNGYRPTLWLAQGDEGEEFGQEKINTNLSTWVEKCAFDANDTYLYCGVPQNLDKGTGIFKADTIKKTDDFIYRIDLSDFSSQMIAVPEDAGGGSVTVTDPFVSADGKTLFFMNARDNGLNSIRLSQ